MPPPTATTPPARPAYFRNSPLTGFWQRSFWFPGLICHRLALPTLADPLEHLPPQTAAATRRLPIRTHTSTYHLPPRPSCRTTSFARSPVPSRPAACSRHATRGRHRAPRAGHAGTARRWRQAPCEKLQPEGRHRARHLPSNTIRSRLASSSSACRPPRGLRRGGWAGVEPAGVDPRTRPRHITAIRSLMC
jgi:hypothetical protein